MATSVRIPTPLQNLTQGQTVVTVEGTTVRQLFDDLECRFPGVKERLYDEGGELRRFINVFVAREDIRFLEGLDTPIEEGQEVSIIPAVAGG